MSPFTRGSLTVLAAAISAEVHAVSVQPPSITGEEGSQQQVDLVVNPDDFVFTSEVCDSTVSLLFTHEFEYSVFGQDGTANWSDSGDDDLYLTDQSSGAIIPVTGAGSMDTIETCGRPASDVTVSFAVNLATDGIAFENDENATLVFQGMCGQDPDAPVVCTVQTDVTVVDATPPPMATISGGSAGESAGTGAFTVTLDSAPQDDVAITVVADSGSTATNPDDWRFQGDLPNEFTVLFAPGQTSGTAVFDIVDDDLAEADETIDVSLQPGTGFTVGTPGSATFTITDDDAAGVSVNPQTLTTSEDGGSGQFDVVLQSQPNADVTISVASEDTSEGTVNTDSLVFAPGDWNLPQSVTVTGQDDDIEDGSQEFAVTLDASSSDAQFNDINVPDVNVTNVDNDMAGISVTPTSITVDEGGGTAQFSVVLQSEPTAEVVVEVVSQNEAEGTVDQLSLSFDAGNWDVPQAVTVTGVDDELDDGDMEFLIALSASSADAVYAMVDPADVTAVNQDNDNAAGIEFTQSPFAFPENVGMAQIEIRRTGAVGTALSADFSTDDDNASNTATAGEDYTSVSETLTWAAGEDDVRIVEIPIEDDAVNEGDESVVLKLEVDGEDETILGELVIQNDVVEDAIAQIDPDRLPANSREIATVILTTCPEGNNMPDFQTLCNGVVGEALEGGSVDGVLREVSPENSAAARTPSMDSARVQNVNVTSRLAELRRGATGISFRSFSLNMAGFSFNQDMLSSFLNPAGADNAMFYMPEFQGWSHDPNALGVSNATASGDDVLTDFGRWGIWVGGRVIFGDKDPTGAESGYDFDTAGLTFGVDYRFTESFVAGLAAGYSDNDADLDANGGSLDSSGLNLTLYGNWFPTDNFYLDASVSVGSNDFDQVRRIEYQLPMVGMSVNQTLEAEFDGDQTGFTLGAGYDFVNNGWIFGPTAFVEYIDVDIDPYDETLTDSGGAGFEVGWASHIDGQSYKSLIPSIGFQVSKAFSYDWGVIVPQGNVSWANELEDDGAIVTGYYLGDLNRVLFQLETDDLDGDFFKAGLGLSAVFPGNKSAYLTVDGDFDRDLISTYYINAGFRWEF